MKTIKPQPKQELFLSSPADICIYGGAAGGGKTYALLMEPIRHIDRTGFECMIFRRTREQVRYAGGLWDESANIYTLVNGKRKDNKLEWHFENSKISFRDLERDSSVSKYDGSQITLLCFDQLEQFTEHQFFYMLSRNRSTCGVKPYVRATCNPAADSWLLEFIRWWISEDGYADLSRAGVVRWFVRTDDKMKWYDSKDEAIHFNPDSYPLSVTFIPSTVYDNQELLNKDPAYIGKLQAMSYVETTRLLGDKERGGNWHVTEGAGKVFNRDWFAITHHLPDDITQIVRFWDIAATEKKNADYTAGVLMAHTKSGKVYVLDCVDFRKEPAQANEAMLRISGQDIEIYGKKKYKVAWESQPAAAGKHLNIILGGLFSGLIYEAVAPKGDKLVRSLPLAAEAKNGNVFILHGDWNKRFINQLHGFPEMPHDDIVDAAAGAYSCKLSFFMW